MYIQVPTIRFRDRTLFRWAYITHACFRYARTAHCRICFMQVSWYRSNRSIREQGWQELLLIPLQRNTEFSWHWPTQKLIKFPKSTSTLLIKYSKQRIFENNLLCNFIRSIFFEIGPTLHRANSSQPGLYLRGSIWPTQILQIAPPAPLRPAKGL